MISIAATEVYTTEDVILQDEAHTTLTLKPLPIRALRKFMASMEELGKVGSEAEGVDALLKLALICIDKQAPDLTSDPDKLEDALDMPTIYKIIEVCGGVKLNDPKLMEMAQQMMVNTAGQTST